MDFNKYNSLGYKLSWYAIESSVKHAELPRIPSCIYIYNTKYIS